MKKGSRLARVCWQVPIQTQNINGGESKAPALAQSSSPALKCTQSLIVIQFSYFANVFVQADSFLTVNAGDTSPMASNGGNVRICRDMHACADLVCEDREGRGVMTQPTAATERLTLQPEHRI